MRSETRAGKRFDMILDGKDVLRESNVTVTLTPSGGSVALRPRDLVRLPGATATYTRDITDYTYGLGLLSQRTTVSRFFRWDGIGTLRNLEDNSRNIVASSVFDAYGLQQNAVTLASAYGFVGEEGVRGEKGLPSTTLVPYHMRARMYDPLTGRFTSRDPIWDNNLYAYANGNPWSNTDASGMQALSDPHLHDSFRDTFIGAAPRGEELRLFSDYNMDERHQSWVDFVLRKIHATGGDFHRDPHNLSNFWVRELWRALDKIKRESYGPDQYERGVLASHGVNPDRWRGNPQAAQLLLDLQEAHGSVRDQRIRQSQSSPFFGEIIQDDLTDPAVLKFWRGLPKLVRQLTPEQVYLLQSLYRYAATNRDRDVPPVPVHSINAAILEIKAAVLAVPGGEPLPAGLRAVFWAISHLGDRSFGYYHNVSVPGISLIRFGSPKCNIFVADAYAIGAGIGWDKTGVPRSHTRRPLGLPAGVYPPGAYDYDTPTNKVMNFPVVIGLPKPGDVVAWSSGPGTGGHSAMYLGGGLAIYAAQWDVKFQTVNYVLTHGHVPPVTYRRYVPGSK